MKHRPIPNPVGDLIISDTRLGVGATDNLSTLTVRARASFNLTGTLSKTAGSVTVTGSGTAFLGELTVGDRISVTSGGYNDEVRTVVAIASDTSLTVDTSFISTDSGQPAVALPSAIRVDDASGNAAFAVNDSGNVAVGTPAAYAQLHVSGAGAGDYVGCPVSVRIHNSADSDAWPIVLSMGSGDSPPAVALWMNGTNATFSIFPGNSQISDVLSMNENGVRLMGGLVLSSTYIGIDYAIQACDKLVEADAGDNGITLTLPPSGDVDGRMISIYKYRGAGNVTVAPSANDTINGDPSSKIITTLYGGLLCVSLGTTWAVTLLTPA